MMLLFLSLFASLSFVLFNNHLTRVIINRRINAPTFTSRTNAHQSTSEGCLAKVEILKQTPTSQQCSVAVSGGVAVEETALLSRRCSAGAGVMMRASSPLRLVWFPSFPPLAVYPFPGAALRPRALSLSCQQDVQEGEGIAGSRQPRKRCALQEEEGVAMFRKPGRVGRRKGEVRYLLRIVKATAKVH